MADAALELLAVPQSLASSYDLSGMRQAVMGALAHPKRFARSFPKILEAMGSEQGFARNEARIAAQPWAQLRNAVDPNWKRSGIAALTRNPNATIVGKFINALPGYRFSQRSFTALLNTVNDEVFGAMVQGAGVPPYSIPQADLRRWSDLANLAVGGGKLPFGGGGDLNTVAGTLLWAPRLLVARSIGYPVEMLKAIKAGDRRALGELSRQVVAFTTVNLAILKLGEAAGLWEVETNPESADFGQMRIGSQRVDPWAGFRPVANLTARMISGKVTSTRTGSRYEKDRWDIALDFLASKLGPIPGTINSLREGYDPAGKPFGAEDAAWRLVTPLFLAELYEATKGAQTLGEVAKRGGIAALGGIGFGVTSYEDTPEDRFAREQGAANFSALLPSQRDAYFQANPERSKEYQEQAAQRQGETGDYNRFKAQLANQQRASDERLERREIDWRQWTEDYRARQQQLVGARQALGVGQGFDQRDTPLERYYAFIRDEATRADGTLDWEAVDAYVAQQPDETQQLIDREVGIGGEGSVRVYRQTSKDLDRSGYYGLRDVAWDAFKAAHPKELGNLPGYWQWRDQETLSEAVRLERELGYEPGVARREAARGVAAYKAVTAFNEYYRTEFRHQWVAEHAELAAQAWAQDRFTPDKQEREFLIRSGAVQSNPTITPTPPRKATEHTIERDRNGRIAALRTDNGLRRRVNRDENGRMVGVTDEVVLV